MRKERPLPERRQKQMSGKMSVFAFTIDHHLRVITVFIIMLDKRRANVRSDTDGKSDYKGEYKRKPQGLTAATQQTNKL